MAHASAPHEGELFAERFIIKRLLGRGGMGEVYLATDAMLGNEAVALKILNKELSDDPKHVQRFLREIQLARKVTSPYVVRVFDVATTGERLYFTMEFVEGVLLTDKVLSGPLPSPEASHIITQLAQGLTAIHAEGIIHRDLKPGNVIVTTQGLTKLTDFGIARPHGSTLTKSHEVIGSAYYMAPEQWTGREVTPAIDLYSLGVLWYELVTGMLPFDGESAAELMAKHLDATPLPPMELCDGVPLWMNNLILSLLAKNSQERPPSAQYIVEAVKAYTDLSNSLAEKHSPPTLPAHYEAAGGEAEVAGDLGAFELAGDIRSLIPEGAQVMKPGEAGPRRLVQFGSNGQEEERKRFHRVSVFAARGAVSLSIAALVFFGLIALVGLHPAHAVSVPTNLALITLLPLLAAVILGVGALLALPITLLCFAVGSYRSAWRAFRSAYAPLCSLAALSLVLDILRQVFAFGRVPLNLPRAALAEGVVALVLRACETVALVIPLTGFQPTLVVGLPSYRISDGWTAIAPDLLAIGGLLYFSCSAAWPELAMNRALDRGKIALIAVATTALAALSAVAVESSVDLFGPPESAISFKAFLSGSLWSLPSHLVVLGVLWWSILTIGAWSVRMLADKTAAELEDGEQ